MTTARGIQGPVLAGVDLSAATGDVLAQANAIALSLKAKLVVGHVLPEALQARMLFPQLAASDREAQAALQQRAREAVEAGIAAMAEPTASPTEIAFEYGSAHAGFLRLVERFGAGLAVVGSGHVAERIARYAPCTVLVARPSPPGSVLAATDFSDPALPAIETAVAESIRRRTSLRLMHCVEFSDPLLLGTSRIAVGVLPALPLRLIEELHRDAEERLGASLANFQAVGECLVTHGTAAASIVDVARAAPTELVVIGMRGRSNLSRVLLGSVAEAVLRTAPCSVMVVHLAR